MQGLRFDATDLCDLESQDKPSDLALGRYLFEGITLESKGQVVEMRPKKGGTAFDLAGPKALQGSRHPFVDLGFVGFISFKTLIFRRSKRRGRGLVLDGDGDGRVGKDLLPRFEEEGPEVLEGAKPPP